MRIEWSHMRQVLTLGFRAGKCVCGHSICRAENADGGWSDGRLKRYRLLVEIARKWRRKQTSRFHLKTKTADCSDTPASAAPTLLRGRFARHLAHPPVLADADGFGGGRADFQIRRILIMPTAISSPVDTMPRPAH
jgi:hypothetical protein